MTKQTKNPIIDLTVASEFSNMMLYENEKKRSEYLENALAEERKRTAELEKLLKESQQAHEVTARNYARQTKKYDEMSSYVGAALSTRRKK